MTTRLGGIAAILLLGGTGCGGSKEPAANQADATSSSPANPPAKITPPIPTKPVNPPPGDSKPDPTKPTTPAIEKPAVIPQVPDRPNFADAEVKQMLAHLADKNQRVRESAIVYFERMGSAANEKYLALLGDKDPAVRRGAAFGFLGVFDPKDARHGKLAIAALADDDASVRHTALQMFTQLSPANQLAGLANLTPLLDPQREYRATRVQVIRLIGALGPSANSALPALLKIAQDAAEKDKLVRNAAIDSLDKICPPTEKPPTELVDGLAKIVAGDKDLELRRLAIARLQAYGPSAGEAAPAIAECLAVENDELRVAAENALVELRATAVPALIAKLDHQDRLTRLLAIRAMGKIGPDAKEAIAPLEKLVKDPDAVIVRWTKAALMTIQPSPPSDAK